MHFHLPKPVHGWREFAGEVGIIVIGVLIALGAEQVVEEWQWHRKVAVVRQSLMGELGNDRARWEADMAAVPCLRSEIDGLDQWAQQGAKGNAPPTSQLEQGGMFWMHSANWHLATGGETLDHFPIREQLSFAALYDGVDHRQAYIGQITDLVDRVLALVPLAAHSQRSDDLRTLLRTLKRKMATLASDNGYMERHFDALRVKPDRSDFAADFVAPSCGARAT